MNTISSWLGRAFSMGTTRGVTVRFGLLAGLQEFAIWLPLPVLILHMTDRGLDLGLIGLAFGLRALLVVLLEVPTGGLADAIGRKPVALGSQTLTLVSFVVLLYAGGPGTAILYALFQGVGAALHSGALDAWYVDAIKRIDPEVPLQRHLAVVDVLQSAGMLVAAAIGGSLPALASGWDLPFPLSGFGIALFAGIAVRALVWLLTAVLVVEPPRTESAGVAGLRAVPTVLRDAVKLSHRIPIVRFLLLSAGASGVALIALETFWQPVAAATFGNTAEDSGAFGALGLLMGFAVLLGSLAILRYGERFPGGSAYLAAATQAGKGVAMLLLASQAGALGIAAGLALSYFALSANNVPHEALLNDAIPSERRSVMLSLNSLSLFLGIAIGSTVLGLLASHLGAGFSLAVAGVFTVLASAAYLGVDLAKRRGARLYEPQA
ncbi:MAG: MFS transporter [Trueperaceae bacterium]